MLLAFLLMPTHHFAQAQREPDSRSAAQKAEDRSLQPLRKRIEREGPAGLLRSTGLRTRLEVTPEMYALAVRAEDLVPRAPAPSTEARPPGAGLPGALSSPALRQQKMTAAAQVLRPQQIKRLWEVALQLEGDRALTWPEVLKELKIRPAQGRKIDAMIQELSSARAVASRKVQDLNRQVRIESGVVSTPDAVRAAYRVLEPRIQAAVEEENAAIDRAARQIRSVLSSYQLELFRKMKGEPFDLKFLREPAPTAQTAPSHPAGSAPPTASLPDQSKAPARRGTKVIYSEPLQRAPEH
jgi:hypothetical protein